VFGSTDGFVIDGFVVDGEQGKLARHSLQF
jgi:hypothetical protein